MVESPVLRAIRALQKPLIDPMELAADGERFPGIHTGQSIMRQDALEGARYLVALHGPILGDVDRKIKGQTTEFLHIWRTMEDRDHFSSRAPSSNGFLLLLLLLAATAGARECRPVFSSNPN